MAHTRLIAFGAVAAGALIVFAGPTDPPAGPVGDTLPTLGYKTLFQAEPRTPISQDDIPLTITTPGSYYLTENLFAVGFGDNVITISSDDVTLDLMGFMIDGATEVSLAINGIEIGPSPDKHSVCVRNGSIRDCEEYGVYAIRAKGAVIEELRVYNCDLGGIVGQGLDTSGLVRNCMVHECGTGIAWTGLIHGCYAESNPNGNIVNLSVTVDSAP